MTRDPRCLLCWSGPCPEHQPPTVCEDCGAHADVQWQGRDGEPARALCLMCRCVPIGSSRTVREVLR